MVSSQKSPIARSIAKLAGLVEDERAQQVERRAQLGYEPSEGTGRKTLLGRIFG